MKTQFRIILTIALAFFISNIYSQNQYTVEIEDFTSINISGRIKLELIQSEAKEIQITANTIDPEKITTSVNKGELSIKLPTQINNKENLVIKLPYQTLSAIRAAAGAVINSARDLHADDLSLTAVTGGKIELSVQAKSIDASISHVSDIILYGKVESQNIQVKTGGNYLADNLACKTVSIKISGASQAKINCSDKLEGSVNSKAYLAYKGSPILDIKTSLGGKIERIEDNNE